MAIYSHGQEFSTRDGQRTQSIIDIDIECTSETIYVFPGTLSENDIVLKYRANNSRRRTPKHIHFTIDLLIKKEHNATLVNSFIDTLLTRWNSIQGLTSRDYNLLLNNLVISRDAQILQDYRELNNYGDYSVEFLLNFGELLMLQEKTNRADAYMFRNVMTNIRNDGDIYSIVSSATHNGR
jgi:hypothetical protein